MREDKKTIIINEAVGVFAKMGYYKATTAIIAQEAGVTQPYVYHFFKNKEELFNAVIDRAVNRIYKAFMRVEAPEDQLAHTMGEAFIEIMNTHKDEMLMVMQAYTIPEPLIREHVRDKYRMIHTAILEKFKEAGSSNPGTAATEFLGMGLLITLAHVLDLPELLCFDDRQPN